MPAHPIHRRYYAEDLIRLRRAGEQRRYAASQRRGRIDPNPHQIDAVMFGLRRIPEGGCILADEVGLGKTIEAGLIISQLLAEGASRILIVVPRPLVGQWQEELFTLFGLEASDAAGDHVDVRRRGVFLAGREYAGGARGSEKLGSGRPFDLFVVDEAHEIFAGIHKRFDRYGIYQEGSNHAVTAHRVRELIRGAPVLLLTATPLQNSLAELWGLVHYVERTQSLLGGLPTFTDLFCERKDGRRLADGQSHELRRRLAGVVQRTLRRQAQEFLERPFVGRSAKLFEYAMEPDERSLYDDVTEYLLEPDLCAFRGRSRQLLLLGFHRRMASSTAALAQSLEKVAERLQSQLQDVGQDELAKTAIAFLEDLEDDETQDEEADAAPAGPERVKAELARVEGFIRRAKDLPHDSKAESLVQVVRALRKRNEGADKVVVFTESLTTQRYLKKLLLERGGLESSDITLFRGTNDTPRDKEALSRWHDEVGIHLARHTQPSPTVAMRLALVHEFRTRSRVFISTEAGAKGLNLQFCDTLVNYDLPWNPQRIEQRIGRCHRYGQSRDVTVINFLAKDNEAQRLTFEILSSKLELFGKVLDMSDAVLHEQSSEHANELATALGPDFEAQLRRIWDRARSVQEVEDELRRLRDEMEGRRRELERVRKNTIGLIENRLDASVRKVFRQIKEQLPETLAELDGELERVATSYLSACDIDYSMAEIDGRRVIDVAASPALPPMLRSGFKVALGSALKLEDVEPLHGAHPLLEAAVEEARGSGSGSFRVRFHLNENAPAELLRRRGTRGRLALTRVAHDGFEREDRLVVTAVLEDAGVLRPEDLAHELLRLPCSDIETIEPPITSTRQDLDEVVDEELFFDHGKVEAREAASFDKAVSQIEQYMEDRILVQRRARADTLERLRKAEEKRDSALGSDARSSAGDTVLRFEAQLDMLDADINRLAAREDDDYSAWKQHAHQRRYKQPVPERLLDVEFVLE